MKHRENLTEISKKFFYKSEAIRAYKAGDYVKAIEYIQKGIELSELEKEYLQGIDKKAD